MSDSLPFTGERFTPECVREIWYEHWHRYAFAARFAHGRRVLDAACGEGYGSALLARVAASVLGADVSAAAIAHARTRYGGRPNLAFEQLDATALDALADASFDLVVSFETLEHVEAQERMVAGFARVLAPDGVLVISSPDRRTYSEVAGFRNEFHVRELYREELDALLAAHFPARRLFGQKLLFQSAMWDLEAPAANVTATTFDRATGIAADGLGYAPLYFVAICARTDAALPPLAGRVDLFGDAGESVYAHYDHEVRKNIAAGGVIAGLERALAVAQAGGAAPSPASVSPAASESASAAASSSAERGEISSRADGLVGRLRAWLAR
ncbi:MAG TPA: class I SAM-dependent methyltransferase [Candidatus Saccharimonadia bacterium]|nr:class I SAM-dependent methyltransferase [Candidatus Saccharimonadia bacterium]